MPVYTDVTWKWVCMSQYCVLHYVYELERKPRILAVVTG
jgi:hypothetical protein